MQWKMIYLARRNPALASEDFPQAWREHSALGSQCHNVRDKVKGVVQCSRLLAAALPGTTRDYDGVNLLHLRDLAAASDIWNDPETLAIMRPDEPRVFSTYVRNFTLTCSEHVVRDVPRNDCALFGFLRRRADVSADAFGKSWLDGTTRWADSPALQTASRVVHNHVVQPPPPGYDYAGIAEWWFASTQALQEAFGTSGIVAGLPRAYADLIDPDASVFIATHVTHHRP